MGNAVRGGGGGGEVKGKREALSHHYRPTVASTSTN